MQMNADLLSNLRLYSRLLQYVRYYIWPLLFGLVGNILFSGIEAGLTYLIKPILNEGFIARDIHFIHFLPLLVIIAFLARGVTNTVGTYCMAMVTRGVVMRLRQNIFNHLLYLPATFYDRSSSGKLLSTILYNVEQVANAGADALTDFVQSGCFIIGLLVVMFSISWQLSSLYIIILPPIAFTVQWSIKRLRSISKSIQSQMGEVTAIANESIEGYKIIRSFGEEHYESNKFRKATEQNRHRELKLVFTKSMTVSGVQLLAGFVVAMTAYLAVGQKFITTLTAGDFVSIMAAMLALLKPLKTFTTVNGVIQKGLAGAESVFTLLDEPREIDSGHLSITRAKGKIEFKNVTFGYGPHAVLNHINFSIEPGMSVAFVGHSGSGKTTIINLLQRFYEIDEGEITLDEKDIRKFKLFDLRRQFSTVSQQITLFDDTIAHNVAYGRLREAYTEEEILKAIKAADLYDFVKNLPKQLDTQVGDKGVLFSGGQRQRIAIARAILKDAPILILDEATSALDTESERRVQKAIDRLMKGRTSLVIAHRLSTIQQADKIILLDAGRIIDSGTHNELLARSSAYGKLYHAQFK